MKRLIVLITLCIALTAGAEYVPRPQRLELSGTFESLLPHDVYGNWKSGSISYFRQASKDLNWFVGLDYAVHDNAGSGFLGDFGAYKDWSPVFYTYSAFSAGTNTQVFAEFRIDHEFNVKVGENKDIVIPFGFTYIQSTADSNVVTLYSGFSAYLPAWLITVKVFLNYSNPNTLLSNSYLISVGNGKEGAEWNYLDLTFGDLTYLPASIPFANIINEHSAYLSYKHRKWLSNTFGWFSDLNYLNVVDSYQKYGATLGIFVEL